jgi:hypothetical protein
VTCVDDMWGKYDYKILMGGKVLPVRSVTIVPSKGLKALRVKCFRILAWALDVSYAKIWRRRLAPKIRFPVGSFWKAWIKSHQLSI